MKQEHPERARYIIICLQQINLLCVPEQSITELPHGAGRGAVRMCSKSRWVTEFLPDGVSSHWIHNLVIFDFRNESWYGDFSVQIGERVPINGKSRHRTWHVCVIRLESSQKFQYARLKAFGLISLLLEYGPNFRALSSFRPLETRIGLISFHLFKISSSLVCLVD